MARRSTVCTPVSQVGLGLRKTVSTVRLDSFGRCECGELRPARVYTTSRATRRRVPLPAADVTPCLPPARTVNIKGRNRTRKSQACFASS
ncbi:hypothetical protein PoB_005914100 [Plakobranchus ocellatus]|uniref:Uncharacterized protein n=1 Tax=Plakobranchus ocellatus TaxID=259542 RepID=A0AAV4CBE9_9GAST|nr:hypothetical protein PoB_005914100 [Plakobranchus ocellatus]